MQCCWEHGWASGGVQDRALNARERRFFFFCHYSFNLGMNNMYNIYRISPMGVKSAGLMMVLSVFGLFILG